MASVSGTPSNSYANSSKSFLNAYLDACIFQRNVCWRNDFDSGAASIKRGANRKAPSHRHSWLGVSRRRPPRSGSERVHHAEYQTAAKTR